MGAIKKVTDNDKIRQRAVMRAKSTNKEYAKHVTLLSRCLDSGPSETYSCPNSVASRTSATDPI